ncbi:MAG: HAD family hydrolase [Mucilaginibacter polytrichastri]|nr:HAD family hydrolase [Mucilaginibacter polytrichastri]
MTDLLAKQNKAVFLDRDGVLNQEMGDYVCRIEDFHVLEHNFEPLKILSEKGYLLIVVTNQGGLAKGWYTPAQLDEMHAHLRDLYRKQGVEFTDIYFCPHHPNFTGDCECRKPKSGMFRDAIKKYNIDPAQSFLIGDRERDVEAAENVGVKGILINSDQPIADVMEQIP